MRLIVLPDAGATPVVRAVEQARRSVDLAIFRFDLTEMARALDAAVHRGVAVRVLLARRSGDKNLRKLEARLVEAGADVARTNGDFIRYHDKMMVVDRSRLYVMGFNLTRADLLVSRSFGLVTQDRRLVREASRLFQADFDRHPYEPALRNLLVSPDNSRQGLTRLIRRARRRLLIYDPHLTDREMVEELEARAAAGVDVRVLGNVGRHGRGVQAQRYPGRRLHVRAIVRDTREVYVGSQGLRKQELDLRREVGLIVTTPGIVRRVVACFEEDWAETPLGRKHGRPARRKHRTSR